MTKGVLFIDTKCPSPYDPQTLSTQTLGGTEATVIRIAEKLSEKIPVFVGQHNRKGQQVFNNVTYGPGTYDLLKEKWQAIIVIHSLDAAIEVKESAKNVPVWVWNHDLSNLVYLMWYSKCIEKNIGIITVSDYAKALIEKSCKEDPFFPSGLKVVRIYNPIADDLKPDDTVIDRNKLVFVSAYHKGLDNTINAFQAIRRTYPFFNLVVTSPSYYYRFASNVVIPGVHYLGPVNHKDNIALIRSAFCVFYINYIGPETFGLVLAEANAVGTPVLTHPWGAAPEVLLDHDQLVNTHNNQEVQDKLIKWYEHGRPQVTVRDEFRISNVIKEWEKLLEST